MADQELDVRPLREPDRHLTVFQAYEALATGDSLVLIAGHDPGDLHDEFEVEYPGGYGWACLSEGPGTWRIKISKLAATPLPRVLTDTATITDAVGPGATGAIWKLQMRERDLDSNIIGLAPGATIDAHAGPDIDVLVHVVSGSGHLTTEIGTLPLRGGTLVWLPRRSRRQFTAGPDGLRYLTVHQRRQALTLSVGT